MSRAAARLRHPSASFAIAEMEVRLAYEDLEAALEARDPGATSEAARIWWDALQRLRAAS